MIKAGIRANRYVRQNRDGAIQVMMVGERRIAKPPPILP